MNKEQASAILSEIATEISQTCSTRSNLMNIYMGPSLSQTHLALFKPILLENYALFASYLKDKKRETPDLLLMNLEDIASSLTLDAEAFLQERLERYASAAEREKAYGEFCTFVILTKANSTGGYAGLEDSFETLANETQLAIRLGAKRVEEVAKLYNDQF